MLYIQQVVISLQNVAAIQCAHSEDAYVMEHSSVCLEQTQIAEI